jgi:membrane associated rhomboid family serine protease
VNPDPSPLKPGFDPDRAFLIELWGRRTPTTVIILVTNVLVYLLMEFAGGTMNEATLLAFGVKSNPAIDQGEIWRFVTPVFIHIGILHLALNSYALWIVGQQVERLYGSARFVSLYVLMGISGVAGSYFYHPMSLSAGASGAIFGLFGVLLIFGLRHRKTVPAFFRRAIGRGVLPVILLNLVIGFAIPVIDNAAHVGGLLAGIALASFVGFKPPGSQTHPFFWATQAIAVATILLSFYQVGLHYDGPRPGIDNFGGGWRQMLSGQSASEQFIEAVNSSQESFVSSRRAIRRGTTSTAEYRPLSEELADSIDRLRSAPTLSESVNDSVENLIAVMEDQYSLVQEILRTERLTPDRRETADLNAVRYGKAQAEILEWVRNEGGKYGLELQDRDEQEGAAGPR